MVWSGVRRMLGRAPGSADTYRPYTTKYDLVINGDEINNFLAGSGLEDFEEYGAELERAFHRWRASVEVAAVEALEALKMQPPKDAVACLLVDHSGSMRGQRAILATAIIEIVADFWSRLGIRYEILGFTTQSWRGGRSRRLWRLFGSPPRPGRLCDLLHIVYRSADDTAPGAPRAVFNLNRRELLKENVDGEAVEWATSRLLSQAESHKILVVISDGAPVDDSTIAANDDEYLFRHLRSAVNAAQAQEINVGAIGMGEFVAEFYRKHVLIDTPQQLSSSLIPFVVEMSRTVR